jgi:hypothetical protein
VHSKRDEIVSSALVSEIVWVKIMQHDREIRQYKWLEINENYEQFFQFIYTRIFLSFKKKNPMHLLRCAEKRVDERVKNQFQTIFVGKVHNYCLSRSNASNDLMMGIYTSCSKDLQKCVVFVVMVISTMIDSVIRVPGFSLFLTDFNLFESITN